MPNGMIDISTWIIDFFIRALNYDPNILSLASSAVGSLFNLLRTGLQDAALILSLSLIS